MIPNYDLSVLAKLTALVLLILGVLAVMNRAIPGVITNAATYLIVAMIAAVGIRPPGGTSGTA